MTSTQSIIFLTVSILFLGSSTSCTRPAEIPLDTLVVALSSGAPTLDPRYATDAVGERLSSLLFNGLVRRGPNLEAVPEAAERWTLQNHTYFFYLRPDLHFHNGRPLRQEDVEFSFASFLEPGGPFATMRDIVRKVDVEQIDGRLRVAIELKNLSDKFLTSDLPSIKLLPKAEVLAAGQDFARKLVGTGPFRLVRQDAGEIELAAVSAKIPHLLFKIIHDDFTRYQKMLRGEVDIAQMEISQERVADFQKRPEAFQVFFYPGLSMTYVLVNLRDPVLAHKEIRQALSQALNRPELIRYKKHGLATEATSLLTPQNKYFDTSLKNLPYDVSAAQTLVKGLGLAGRELTLKTSNSPDVVDVGKVLAYQMAQSGLKVGLQSFEWGTFYGDVKRGDFQLATMKWVGTVDPDLYKIAFHSLEVPPGRNRGYYLNPRLDALLDAGSREPDVKKRRKIYFQVQEIVQSDLAVIPLWYDQQIAIAKRQVINYHPTQTGDYWPLVEASKSP